MKIKILSILMLMLTLSMTTALIGCGKDKKPTIESEQTHTHSLVRSSPFEATCTSDGNIECWTCSGCHKIFSDQEATNEITIEQTVIPSTGHNYGELIAQDDPTCTKDGKKAHYECSYCQLVFDENKLEVSNTSLVLPKEDHLFTNYVSNGDATCTTDGTKTAQCEYGCGTTNNIDDPDSAIGHSEITHDAQAPSCTQIGWNAYVTCEHCNYTTYRELEKTDHTRVTDEAVDPTCTNTGLTEGSHCKVCGEVFVQQTEVAKLGHNEVSHDAKAPTCTEVGWNAYVSCSRCDYTTYSEIPAKEHTVVIDDGKAPTCTEGGLTEGKHCSVCNTVLVEQTQLNPTGHQSTTSYATKDPTCTEIGWKSYIKCNNCDYSTYVEIPALGHTYSSEWVYDKTNHWQTTTCDHESEIGNNAAHDYDQNDICKTCFYEKGSTIGLKYTLSSDGTYYSLTGMGTATDTDVVIPSTYKNLPVKELNNAFYDCTTLTSVVIPDSITIIDNYAFKGCSSLESIEIPQNVKLIGNNVFTNCTSLSSITIPEKVTSIGQDAFKGCTNLTSLNMLFGLTTIGNSAFNGCTGLSEVVLPNSVTEIGSKSFYKCSNLTSVVLSENLNTIGSSSFYGCSKLPQITIPESVTQIGGSSFNKCTSLTTITIPEKVTTIGNSAFGGCTGLTQINFNAIALEDLAYSYNNVFQKAGTEASGIIVNIGAKVTKIPSYLFYPSSSSGDSPKITQVIFAENSVCESIGYNAFEGCTTLTSIIIPNSVKTIYSCAFYKCTGLVSVTIGSNVTSIGDSVFSYCTSLTSITFVGTIEQWNAITKGNPWDYNSGAYTITCTDGTIAKDGTVTYN